jgi:hypothetical protein
MSPPGGSKEIVFHDYQTGAGREGTGPAITVDEYEKGFCAAFTSRKLPPGRSACSVT